MTVVSRSDRPFRNLLIQYGTSFYLAAPICNCASYCTALQGNELRFAEEIEHVLMFGVGCGFHDSMDDLVPPFPPIIERNTKIRKVFGGYGLCHDFGPSAY